MKLTQPLVFTILLFSSLLTNAQQEVVIIDKGESNTRVRKPRELRLNENTRVVKFAPLNMLIGEIGFGYEHKVDSKSSLDFEFGPTISEIGFDVNTHYFDAYSSNYSYRTSGLGAFGSVGYRFYPLDETEALNRFYVSPILKYKLLTYTANSADPNANLDPKRGTENQLNFYFNFGHQVWLSKSFCLDMYCGMGIGYKGTVDYTINSEYVGTEWVSSWRTQKASGARYVFDIGIKVGIGSKGY